MPAMRYTLSTADYVSDEMRAALRRRLHELVGAVLLGVAGTAAVALATWSVQDPSLSHATNAPVRNMLGLTGAASADLMMQLLGIATIAFLFPVAAWGWRLVTHRPLDRERMRLVLWILGALAAAGSRWHPTCSIPTVKEGRPDGQLHDDLHALRLRSHVPHRARRENRRGAAPPRVSDPRRQGDAERGRADPGSRKTYTVIAAISPWPGETRTGV